MGDRWQRRLWFCAMLCDIDIFDEHVAQVENKNRDGLLKDAFQRVIARGRASTKALQV